MSTQDSPHIPIMVPECLDFLDVQPNDCIIDGTLGFGGHSQAILDKLGPSGHLLGLDQDPDAIAFCENRFKEYDNCHCIQDNAANFSVALKRFKHPHFNKFFMDLGLSSYQLDHPDRGFSFGREANLDMRMNTHAQLTAKEVLNTYPLDQLKDLFLDHSDLRVSEKFLTSIGHFRRKKSFETTEDLLTLIKKGFFFHNNRRKYIKTCSQVFQALRMEVNQELDRLRTILDKLPDYIAPEGRIVFLTFHSIEDRLIKRFFQERKDTFKKLTKHVVKPSQDEIRENSRAKPAKLRGYRYLGPNT